MTRRFPLSSREGGLRTRVTGSLDYPLENAMG